jgi:hypothetical protein
MLFLLTERLESAWFFRTSISSVTPIRSVTRCAEPTAVAFIPQYFFIGHGNKMLGCAFT